MKTKINLSNDEIRKLLGVGSADFPKYSTQLINLANQNAQGTRPKVVGQMSELIQQFSGKSIQEWEEWYLLKHPKAIEKATEKVAQMIENFKSVMNDVDKQMIQNWVRDLVIIKTFIGLRFHKAVLIKTSNLLNTSYKLASPQEESMGIDGYVGNTPVSIKPETYKSKKALQEEITAKLIYYKKTKNGLTIDISEII